MGEMIAGAREAVLVALVGMGLSGLARAQEYPTFGEIERLDPRVDALIPPGARIEVLASGFEWAEGPVWVPEGDGALLFVTGGLACVCPFGNANTGEACFTSVDCAPGNVCEGTTPPGRCRRVCDPANPTTCQSDDTCQTINGQPMLGFCRPDS